MTEFIVTRTWVVEASTEAEAASVTLTSTAASTRAVRAPRRTLPGKARTLPLLVVELDRTTAKDLNQLEESSGRNRTTLVNLAVQTYAKLAGAQDGAAELWLLRSPPRGWRGRVAKLFSSPEVVTLDAS